MQKTNDDANKRVAEAEAKLLQFERERADKAEAKLAKYRAAKKRKTTNCVAAEAEEADSTEDESEDDDDDKNDKEKDPDFGTYKKRTRIETMNVSADFRKFHDNLAELVGTQKTWFVHNLKTVLKKTRKMVKVQSFESSRGFI